MTALGRTAMAGGWVGGHVRGQGAVGLSGQPIPALMGCGTLMVEFTLERGQRGPLPLVHHATRAGWPRLLSLTLTADGRFAVTQRQGDAFHSLSLDAMTETQAGGRMRLIWTWDGPSRHSLMTLEALDAGTLRQRAGADPLPLPRDDVSALLGGVGAARLGPAVEWLALGSHAQPVGPGACFAPSTLLDTPLGPRPAAAIRAGDQVETADAGPQRVLWSGRLSLPSMGALRPVRLCAPSFGSASDLWVLPHHRIAVSGASVEYLFGEDEVLIEARHLVDGCTALQPDQPAVLGWQGILLESHHLLIADGCRIESLFAGALARQPALAATTILSGLAAAGGLPLHRKPARRILCAYEAATLISSRAQGRGPVAA